MEGRRNSRDVSAKRESRQSIESYKNETETTTTEVAIIGFEEKPIEHSSDSSTPVSQGGTLFGHIHSYVNGLHMYM